MIDTNKPIETLTGKPAVILMVETSNSRFPIVGRISNSRICSWDHHGNPSTNMAIDRIRNCPVREKIPITFNDVKEGVIFRSKTGNEVYMPLKCHNTGIMITWDDSGTIFFLPYERLMELEFQYKQIGAGLKAKQEWKACYTYRTVPDKSGEDEEDEEDEDDDDLSQ
jgi:hypothetical protein